MATKNISAQEVVAANKFLEGMGFSPDKKNPEWYRSVVVSMIAQPGTQLQIEENAYFVGRVLREHLKDRRDKESHPNFHFGWPEVRDYFFKRVQIRRVGTNHTFDEIEPYCITHGCSYAIIKSHENKCTFSCLYGFRYEGHLTRDLLKI